jgi:hypothetical protein
MSHEAIVFGLGIFTGWLLCGIWTCLLIWWGYLEVPIPLPPWASKHFEDEE